MQKDLVSIGARQLGKSLKEDIDILTEPSLKQAIESQIRNAAQTSGEKVAAGKLAKDAVMAACGTTLIQYRPNLSKALPPGGRGGGGSGISIVSRELGRKRETISRWIDTYKRIKAAGGFAQYFSKHAPDIIARWEASLLTDREDKDSRGIFLYNIWNISGGDDKDYFGHFPSRFMYNLLYYHTKPGDVVFDPFAGTGTTADICKEVGCDFYCSDINPQRDFIKKWDIAAGLPSDLPKVDLAFIDPPYWIQAKNKYSSGSDDWGNVDLENFNKLFCNLLGQLDERGINRIAVVISPTQWSNHSPWRIDKGRADHKFTHHIVNAVIKLDSHYDVEMEYSLPYSTQQYNGTQVKIAKENKIPLVLTRALWVWVRR